ncbi:hypothetical protein ACEPAG_2209 [Sanghuangporus baumii]
MALFNSFKLPSPFVVFVGIVSYGIVKGIIWLSRPLFSPLRDLPGPPSSNFILGNLQIYRTEETFKDRDQWLATYGKVMRIKAFFGEGRLYTTDTRALNHVLTHSMDYQKPRAVRFTLARTVGDGILVTEGEQHRQQNPSFAPSSIKDLTPIFFDKAIELRDLWKSELESEKAGEKDLPKPKRIEVLGWLSRTTLDIIGLAGFHYRFDALRSGQAEDALSKAFATLLHGGGLDPFSLLQAFVPILRIIPTRRKKEEQKARNTMRQIGEQLLAERRKGGALEMGRDLLSVLVRANTDTDLPESQRMNDEDVLAQVPTFLVAGHETTSSQTAWALFVLAQHPEIQSRLRTELQSICTDCPSADDLGSERLPYLDAVVKEVMRVHSVVPLTERVAMKDDIIPVSEPYFDRKGNLRREIRIKKGEAVQIPILSLHRSKDIWGDDASEFNPERWFKPHPASRDLPGVWSNLMAFLGGARSCIGYRFALYEMKALLFTLLRTFEFSLAIPADMITIRSTVVMRPVVHGETRAQMPLMVKLYAVGS